MVRKFRYTETSTSNGVTTVLCHYEFPHTVYAIDICVVAILNAIRFAKGIFRNLREVAVNSEVKKE